jgi:N-methylhydantoinase A
LVNFHLVAEVKVEKPDFPKITITGKKIEDALFDNREVDFEDLGAHTTAFYNRDLLEPNMQLQGPAVIAEKDTTTVVTPMHTVNIDEYGNLILTLEKE